MTLPFVSRAYHDVEVRRLTDALAFCRGATDRERTLVDRLSADNARLTALLMEMATPAPKSLPMPPQSMSPVIIAGIKDIAGSDHALERVLLERARYCLKAKPDATPDDIVDALRFGPVAIAEFVAPTEAVA